MNSWGLSAAQWPPSDGASTDDFRAGPGAKHLSVCVFSVFVSEEVVLERD